MMERQLDRPQRRLLLYAAVLALLLAVGYTAGSWDWHGSTELHTVQEVLATATALFAGAMSLVRHHTKRQLSFLLLGGGMVGAGILDGYHAVVTSSFLSAYFSHSVGGLAAWSALVSRVYLSMLVCASCVATDVDDHEPPAPWQDRALYWLMATALAVGFLSFGWDTVLAAADPRLPGASSGRTAPGPAVRRGRRGAATQGPLEDGAVPLTGCCSRYSSPWRVTRLAWRSPPRRATAAMWWGTCSASSPSW